MRKIYLASSFRNSQQPEAVRLLRKEGHEVYDFREKEPISWGAVRPPATPEELIETLMHPEIKEYFAIDHAAMEWCDTGVLLLPCNRSAHLEIGWLANDKSKQTFVVLSPDAFEPELMYLECNGIVTDLEHLLHMLDSYPRGDNTYATRDALWRM